MFYFSGLLPNDPHLVVGDTLVLNCTVEAPYNSSGIIFVTADGTVDPKFVHIVSTTTAQLVIPNIQAQARPYTCKWPLHGDDFPSQMVQVSGNTSYLSQAPLQIESYGMMND